MTQIHQIKSIFVYVIEFDHYATHIKYNNTTLMFIFEKNLKIEFQKEFVQILNKITTGKFNNLKKLKKKAINANQ